MIMLTYSYSGATISTSGKIVASKVWHTSHLFLCWLENFNVVGCQIVFPLSIFGQSSKSKGWFIGIDLVLPKRIRRAHFLLFTQNNHVFSSVVASSSLIKLVLFAHATHWRHKRPIHIILFGGASHTMIQIIGTKPKLVKVRFKVFEIIPKPIVTQNK